MEQVITTAIAQARTSLQEQSALSTNLEQKVLSLRENYQSFENFASDFNPNSQVDFGSDVRGTIMNDYSTLEMLDMAFGDGSASAWLVTSLADLNKFSGSKNMDDGQTKWLAKLLFQEYKNVKYSVMQLFFYRFKVGDFGKFWGKVDPMVITCALKDFIAECEVKKQEYLNEEYVQKKQEDDARRELWLKVETQWWSCQKTLAQSCNDKEGKDLFLRMELQSYDSETKTLMFGVTHEDYKSVEGKYITLFSQGMKKFFPGATVQYRIKEQQPVAEVKNPIAEKEKYLRQREIEAGLESAEKIISNVLGLDKDQLDQMRYGFKLRYKYAPEEYIQKFAKK